MGKPREKLLTELSSVRRTRKYKEKPSIWVPQRLKKYVKPSFRGLSNQRPDKALILEKLRESIGFGLSMTEKLLGAIDSMFNLSNAGKAKNYVKLSILVPQIFEKLRETIDFGQSEA